ncbi:DNRLRE domain-containing protein [Peribacillus alkalitolerans]|uniref:DNRLRE domain-containing protein n=1 Tax=Peribacillus alkalitolerans TaxID=1550385 RepID=UPI0013D2743E|nr:DNRLRE domain-containing protein [Peribacillus alkalitolerans]
MPTQTFKVGEMLNKRTENSKTWMNFDGSYTTEIHQDIVHYQDENYNLQNINTDLYDEADFDEIDFPVAKDGDSLFYESRDKAKEDKRKNRLDRDKFDFQGLKVPFECKIPRNIKRGYSIGKGQSKLKFIPVGASTSKGYVEGNKITYQDVWNDADLVLEVLPTGIKETIILKSERAPIDFSFEVQGELSEELKIQPPWLEDANGEKRDVLQGVSEVDGKVHLSLAADVTGLIYPIAIDPTVTINTSSTSGKDAWLYSGDSNNHYDSLSIGLPPSGGTFYESRSALMFDLSSIPSGAVGISADLELYGTGYVNNYLFVFQQVWISLFSAVWSENTITWNNKPSVTVSALTTYTGNPSNSGVSLHKFSGLQSYITTFAGQAENPGFMLWIGESPQNYSQDLNFFSRIDSNPSYRPKLVVTYNQPPTAPTLTAPNGGETWNSSHTVTWNKSTDPDPNISYFGPFSQSGSTFTCHAGNHPTQTFKATANALLQVIDMYGHNNSGGSYVVTASVYTLAGNGTLQTLLGSRTFTVTSSTGLKILTWDFSSLGIALTNGQMYGMKLSTTDINGIDLHYGQTYADGALYNGAWVVMSSDLSFRIGITVDAMQYQIQLSTNNGSSWKNIIALTSVGVTNYLYDFINEAETSTAKIRIRAYDGSAYGPWDESNGVFTIVHNQAPTAPTNINPHSTTIDRAIPNRFSWQHNDPNSNDPQSKFTIQWRLQGTSTWNEFTSNTINQFYDFVANNFPKGTIEWRVQTYDQAGLSSPYSSIATFVAGEKPTKPTIVAPGPSVAIANPTVQWSSVDQVGFSLKVKNSTGTPVFDIERTSSNKAETITFPLANQQNYDIELKIKNADGLYSDASIQTISVSYTPPAIPDIATVKGDSFIQINITDPIPSGTQPNVLYHDIYKEVNQEFVLVGTNVQETFPDYQVASNEIARYFVRTHGDNGTFVDTISFTESISFKGVWLHIIDEPEETNHQFILDGDGRSSRWGLESAVHKFQGRKSPVIETGFMEEFSVNFSLQILSLEEKMALNKVTMSGQTVCYRDGRGRKVFGIFIDMPMEDERWGYSTSLSLMKIDFKEGIE